MGFDSESDKQNRDRSDNHGVVTSVRGGVVDMRFDGPLPAIHSVLHAGVGNTIVVEVLTQRDQRHVRGVALTSTEGLARGTVVTDTGAPLQAPVGKAIVSRMFDVFGNVIDRGVPLADVSWRSVHRDPPTLEGRRDRPRRRVSRRRADLGHPLPDRRHQQLVDGTQGVDRTRVDQRGALVRQDRLGRPEP